MPETTETQSPAAEEKGRDELLKALKGSAGPLVTEIVREQLGAAAQERRGFSGPFQRSAERAPDTPGQILGKQILAICHGRKEAGGKKGAREEAITWAKSHFPNDNDLHETLQIRAEAPAFAKGMAAGNYSDSAAFGILPAMRDQVIDFLRPRTVVLKSGPIVFPMPERTGVCPKIVSDVSASYRGESQPPRVTRLGSGERMLSAKELTAKIPISNKLVRRPTANALRFVEKAARARTGVRMDQALLLDTGGEHTPRGLYHLATDKVPAASGTTPTFATVLAELGNMIGRVASSNVELDSLTWNLPVRIDTFLKFQVLTQLGVPYFLDQMAKGSLLGFPYHHTTTIPTNLGVGANETWILLAAYDHVIFGDCEDFQIRISDEATYEEDGVLKSAFDRDETLLLIQMSHDIQVEHDEALTVKTGVQWGG